MTTQKVCRTLSLICAALIFKDLVASQFEEAWKHPTGIPTIYEVRPHHPERSEFVMKQTFPLDLEDILPPGLAQPIRTVQVGYDVV